MKEIPNEYLEKIQKLFKTYGIKSVTMDDVSRELGISKKTLYTYFNDKTELVEQILINEFTQKKCEIEESLKGQDNAIEELFAHYKFQAKMMSGQRPSFIYDLKKYYGNLFTKFTQLKREAIMNGMKSNLERGIKEGLYRKDMDVEIVVKIHLSRMESFNSHDVIPFDEMFSEKFIKEAFKYHAYAVVSDEGRKILKNNIDKLIENA